MVFILSFLEISINNDKIVQDILKHAQDIFELK